jgi:transposase
MDRGTLEGYLERGLSLERIGKLVDRHPSTVAYWVKRHGLKAVGSDRYGRREPLARGDLEALVAEGLTLREMAQRLDRSLSSVAWWLARHELKTARVVALEAARDAPAELERNCRKHGVGRFVRESTGFYRCTRCRAENVAESRRRTKRRLVKEAGGGCALCGYDRYTGALHFHHVDPATKSFALSRHGSTRSIEQLRREAVKCVLLCSNCHAEVEGGIVQLPRP